MKKLLICLDFDGTLFDTGRVIFSFPEIVQWGKGGFSKVLEEYYEFSKDEFLPEKFSGFLKAEKSFSVESADRLASRFTEVRERAPELVFEDALFFINQFPKGMLAILTRAHPDWQEGNISASGLRQYFSKVFIVKGKNGKRDVLEKLSVQYGHIIFIDDSPKEIDQVLGVKGVKAILLNRQGVIGRVGPKDLREVLSQVKELLGFG